jgi:type II secretory pathway pseudopilin PulG
MSKSKSLSISLLMVLAVVTSACGILVPKAQPTVDPAVFQATLNAASTQAIQTIVAQITATAQAQPQEPTQAPTEQPTLVVFTPTTEPTATASFTPTNTPPPPTATRPPATATSTPTATAGPFECRIVSQSPALGAKINAGTDFDMVWVLKNTGTKRWELGAVDIKYTSGSKLQKFGDVFDLAKTIEPGGEITITIDMLAPSIAGTYKAVWNLVGESGNICTMNMHIEVP